MNWEMWFETIVKLSKMLLRLNISQDMLGCAVVTSKFTDSVALKPGFLFIMHSLK